MTLFKYNAPYNDPFSGLDALLDHFSRGFRNTFAEAVYGRQIPVNLYENEDSYELRAELPGVRKEDVNLEIENAVLTIKAKREFDGTDKRETTFSREITVGDDVDSEKVKARMEDGILSIHLPKQATRRPKAIKVS